MTQALSVFGCAAPYNMVSRAPICDGRHFSIAPGAFKKSIADGRVPMHANHPERLTQASICSQDSNNLALLETRTGLYFYGYVHAAHWVEICTAVRALTSGVSVSWNRNDEAIEEQGDGSGRIISATLRELSIIYRVGDQPRFSGTWVRFTEGVCFDCMDAYVMPASERAAWLNRDLQKPLRCERHGGDTQ